MYIKKIKSLKFTDDENITFTQNEAFSQSYNIIFGLNGSGKSSISRLINSYSSRNTQRDKDIKGEVEDYKDIILSNDIPHENIFVFNRDFIDENLIFSKVDKAIKDNYISISKSNIKQQAQIENLNQQIKRWDSKKTGLEKKLEICIKEKIHDNIISQCGNQLTRSQYNITNLKEDLNKYQLDNKHSLSDNDLTQKSDFLKNYKNEYKNINKLVQSRLIENTTEILKKLKTLVDYKQIKTNAIDRLTKDSNLNSWVSTMYDTMINNTNQNACPFCETTTIIKENQPPTNFNNFFKILQQHFNDEYKKVETIYNDINNSINSINTELYKNNEFISKSFTFIINDDNTNFEKEIKPALNTFYDSIKALINNIKEIAKDKFNSIQSSNDNVNNINNYNEKAKSFERIKDTYNNNIEKLNNIIETHNNQLKDRETNKNEYIQSIKHHYLHKNIKYYKKCNNLRENINSYIDKKRVNIKDIEKTKQQEINEFKNQYIKKTNELIGENLGISLELEDKKIILKKDNKLFDINKLSEGQKNIILFCYFIALVKNSNIKDSNKIIVIDDPHCSLDVDYLEKIVLILRDNIQNINHQVFIFSHNDHFICRLNTIIFKKELEELEKLEKKELTESEKKSQILFYVLNFVDKNIKLSNIKNKWRSPLVEYIDLYKKLIDFHTQYKAGTTDIDRPKVRDFIEELGLYIYPRYESIDTTSLCVKIKIEDATLVNYLSHIVDPEVTPEQKNKYCYTIIDHIINSKNEKIKLHIEQLNKAIKEY